LLRARQLDSGVRVRRVQQQQVLAAFQQLLHQRDAVGVVFDVKQPAAPWTGLGYGSGNHGQTPSHALARGTVRWSA
jgi:hypothetical protein